MSALRQTSFFISTCTPKMLINTSQYSGVAWGFVARGRIDSSGPPNCPVRLVTFFFLLSDGWLFVGDIAAAQPSISPGYDCDWLGYLHLLDTEKSRPIRRPGPPPRRGPGGDVNIAPRSSPQLGHWTNTNTSHQRIKPQLFILGITSSLQSVLNSLNQARVSTTLP